MGMTTQGAESLVMNVGGNVGGGLEDIYIETGSSYAYTVVMQALQVTGTTGAPGNSFMCEINGILTNLTGGILHHTGGTWITGDMKKELQLSPHTSWIDLNNNISVTGAESPGFNKLIITVVGLANMGISWQADVKLRELNFGF